MKSIYTFCAIVVISSCCSGWIDSAYSADPPKLDNPISVRYLQDNLRKDSPRLVFTPQIEANLRSKLKSDPVVKNVYKAIQLNAAGIMREPLAKRVVVGRRLLSMSRKVLYRMNMLGMVYRMEKDPDVLKRINKELIAVSHFSDWNPSHFLDTAEMSLAVALGLDWTAGDLPESTIKMAQRALIEKGLKPNIEKRRGRGTNNWNQVCNGGMIAGAIAIAELDPELAAETISNALEYMPRALHEYWPDGMYPEGSTYWGYGTGYSVVTSSMLESAFGTDFGLAEYPAFMESALFRKLMNTPAGWYYNFGDCGDRRDENGDFILAWFAAKTGNKAFFERERFLRPPAEMETLSRHGGAGLVWLSQFEEKSVTTLPTAWKADGRNPIVIIRGAEGDPRGYYFGGKGGRAAISHGNMDAGSFMFELDGVRWALDLGKQDYHALEKTGFNLWGSEQDAERWTLLTKSNFGHSTLSINNQQHRVNGTATIIDFKKGEKPEATIDMTPIFGELLKSAQRKFIKDSPASIVIEDRMELTEKTDFVVWQMLTQADVEIVEGGAVLKQDGKRLNLENLSHPKVSISVVSLDPPPLKLDRKYSNLKRLELRLPARKFNSGKGTVKIRLSGV